MTQTQRLVQYLRSHPGASGLELIAALTIVNHTGRISDARAAGFDIVCEKREGISRYWLKEAPVQLEAFR